MPEPINVLLVEDNPGDAMLIRRMLLGTAQEEFRVETVSRLDDALQQLQQSAYHIVLLDLTLPDSNGLETLLRTRAEATESAIVVLTGSEDTSLGIETMQAGAQDYLSKDNVNRHLLVRTVRYAIERHTTRTALRRSEREYRSLIDDVFDTSSVAVFILDQDIHVVWCNEAAENYFGVEREHLLGRDKRQLVEDEIKYIFADPDGFAGHVLQAYNHNSFTDRFECHVLPDGDRQERWLEHWSQPIRDGMYRGGRIEQYTEITDRKRLEFAEREQRELAEAMSEISTLLTGSLDLRHVLGQILSNLGRVVPHDSASITLVDNDHYQVVEFQGSAARGTPEIRAERSLHTDYGPYMPRMEQTGDPVIVADLQQASHIQVTAVNADMRAYIGTPIQVKEQTLGFIHLLSQHAEFFTDEHSQRLAAFSKLAAIAIQNAQLFAQSNELAALEERQRLARDLHDSVSQLLFTCRAMSEGALQRWDSDPPRARQLVTQVNQLAARALTEMRILLFELRPDALTEVGLKQLFEQYLEPIQARQEFELVLALDDLGPLPPAVQIALYRITQEALNNISKHAGASRVEVQVHESIAEDGASVRLSIRDNGRGFNIDEIAAAGFGLQNMRERAHQISAELAINSLPDQGTEITATWQRVDRYD